MFKRLILLSSIAGLAACSSYNEKMQCDTEKNYIISNPQAIEEYKKLDSEHKIRSIYYIKNPNTICNWDSCVKFNISKFDFVEKYFDDQYRKGIYKIYATNDLSRKDCFENDPAYPDLKATCFYAIKSVSEKPESIYIKEFGEDNDTYKSSFYNKEKDIFLFKISSQAYSSHALIGTNSSGFCKNNLDNHPEYNFKPSRLGN